MSFTTLSPNNLSHDLTSGSLTSPNNIADKAQWHAACSIPSRTLALDPRFWQWLPTETAKLSNPEFYPSSSQQCNSLILLSDSNFFPSLQNTIIIGWLAFQVADRCTSGARRGVYVYVYCGSGGVGTKDHHSKRSGAGTSLFPTGPFHSPLDAISWCCHLRAHSQFRVKGERGQK